MHRLWVTALTVATCLTSIWANSGIAITKGASKQQAAPRVMQLTGLKAPVTVRRDERDIPYIEAANEEDLIFAQGYVTASDRLWQMDLLRRTAKGELAEIFGQVALGQDKQHRTLGFGVVTDKEAETLKPQSRAILENYARGVNAYIDSCKDESLPVEFRLLKYRPRPWRPADSLLVGKNLAEALSTTWPLDIARLAFANISSDQRSFLMPIKSPLDVLIVGRDKPAGNDNKAIKTTGVPLADGPAALSQVSQVMETMRRSLERVGLYAEDLAASNNWVVSGKHTVTGKPMLANDPHLQPSAPSIWYMTELIAPGFHVAGVTIPGSPGITLGHNDSIAWGATNLGPDVQDLYLETFADVDPQLKQPQHRYKTPTGLQDAEVRREEIKVRKGFADAATNSEFFDVTVTRHGPIVFEQGGQKYALRWTALDPHTNDWEAFYRVNHAHNWNEFCAGLSLWEGASQNFVYADVNGHIGYYGAGKIPIRKTGQGEIPYDGSNDDGEWTGYIPFDKLPHVLDPPSGIIVTANSRVVGDDYPYFLTHAWAGPNRSRRIHDLLTAKPKLSVDDFRAIQGDIYTISGDNFAKAVVKLGKAAAQGSNDEKWQELIRLFESWDGKVTPDSRVAPLVAEMRRAFQLRIFAVAAGPAAVRQYRWPNSETVIDRLLAEQPKDLLPKEFADYAGLLKACFQDAAALLTKQYGADPAQWTWARYNPARFSHPLVDAPFIGGPFKIDPFPQGGGGGQIGATPNVGSFVSMRLIADTSNWDNSRQGIALGESGDPASLHWKDQLDAWRGVDPHAFPFSPAAVKQAAHEDLILKP